ncbi:hypothetical protein H1R17_05520 [Flavobacterium sp. xlx-214]|uniref:hypothetical protein n=1 Tax=unclassified Flavobacterium TaxID=196869 RepID=UPI0013D5A227|nr:MULTISPECIES: hypothetical protein [unclassified Flavobacterium]MBA5793663.1 hypothetical protein [Flavobacterium sp. xlx-221]QMI84589.1 hypothetical protein H1R17_05520 [Flavobacterium sp. xlx-214]
MYTGLQHAHSFVAYAALILLIVASLNAIIGMTSNKSFKDGDRKIALFALIFTHIQLLVGLILYFQSPMVQIFNMPMGEVMKDANLRLYAVEHPLINIIAVVLITIGFSKHKKATTDKAKFKSIAIMYALGTILILSRIPWSNWL